MVTQDCCHYPNGGRMGRCQIILAILENVVVEAESQHGVVVVVECTELPSNLLH